MALKEIERLNINGHIFILTSDEKVSLRQHWKWLGDIWNDLLKIKKEEDENTNHGS